jgi:predicted transposase YbfD/YdcC
MLYSPDKTSIKRSLDFYRDPQSNLTSQKNFQRTEARIFKKVAMIALVFIF